MVLMFFLHLDPTGCVSGQFQVEAEASSVTQWASQGHQTETLCD